MQKALLGRILKKKHLRSRGFTFVSKRLAQYVVSYKNEARRTNYNRFRHRNACARSPTLLGFAFVCLLQHTSQVSEKASERQVYERVFQLFALVSGIAWRIGFEFCYKRFLDPQIFAHNVKRKRK